VANWVITQCFYGLKKVLKKNVRRETAVEELINLIREHGDWVDEN
jgi:hypothetical protein